MRLIVLIALLAGFAACSTPPSRRGEAGEAACADGLDNDSDGLTDCDEPACMGLASCLSDAGPDGSAIDGGPTTCGAPIDVVFVIDVSTSMADEVEAIRAGLDSIWAATQELTDDAQFSLVVFVDTALAVRECAAFDTVTELQTEFELWRGFTATNRQPTTDTDINNTDCAENTVDALHLAATTCPWRAEATSILIHVTDDTFAESPARLSDGFLGGLPVEHTYAEAVDALVANEIRVGAFAAPGAGEFCGVTTSPNVGQGFHESYLGMASLPEATGGRAFDIRAVRAGTLDMAEAINALIHDEYCTLF